jgi:copper chaperone CopZ
MSRLDADDDVEDKLSSANSTTTATTTTATTTNNNNKQKQLPKGNVIKSSFRVTGMTCASCVAIIENYLLSTDGVLDVSVALLQESATIKHNADIISVMQLFRIVSRLICAVLEMS